MHPYILPKKIIGLSIMKKMVTRIQLNFKKKKKCLGKSLIAMMFNHSGLSFTFILRKFVSVFNKKSLSVHHI